MNYIWWKILNNFFMVTKKMVVKFNEAYTISK